MATCVGLVFDFNKSRWVFSKPNVSCYVEVPNSEPLLLLNVIVNGPYTSFVLDYNSAGNKRKIQQISCDYDWFHHQLFKLLQLSRDFV